MMAHWAGTGLHPVRGHIKTRHDVQGYLAKLIVIMLFINELPQDFVF